VKFRKRHIFLLIMQLSCLRAVPTGINRVVERGCVWAVGCQHVVDKRVGLRSMQFPPPPHHGFVMCPYALFFARPVNRLSSANEKCYLGNMGTLMENILERGWAVPWLGQLVASFSPRKLGLDPILALWDLW
jgi:hypothetical protein